MSVRLGDRGVVRLSGLGLAAAYLAVLVLTAKDIGYARDEGFYFTAARSYGRWFDALSDDPSGALERRTIDRFWAYNHEHPALMKTLFGFSERIFRRGLGVLGPGTAMRLPGMLSAALCVYLLFVFGSSVFDRRAGLAAALAFVLMPRTFYHAHLACFDIPMTAAWLVVGVCYWRSLSSWKWGLAAGLAFALALCVKLNAFFLPFVLGGHYIALFAFRRATRSPGPPPRPWAFLFGLLLAPPIFLGHWPWLWHDTWARLLEYVSFHAGHPHYNTAWFGENIIRAPTPVMLPLVMTVITVPAVTLVLAAAGSVLRARHHVPDRLEARLEGIWPANGTRASNGLDLLIAIMAVFPILLVSLPSVPKFGGTKHWMPAYPWLALLAGVAASRLADLASARLRRLQAAGVRWLVVALLFVAPLQQTVASHPLGLCNYSPLAGGAPGAASLGMTRQFWGYTTLGVLPFVNKRTPSGAGVFFHDSSAPSVEMLREEGRLRRDIRSVGIANSHLALVHHELHMIIVEAWIWNAYGTIVPAYVLTHQGVPIVSVYERPASPP